MPVLAFFKQNKKSKTETVRTKKPSTQQLDFANAVLEIIGPAIENFDFQRQITEVEAN